MSILYWLRIHWLLCYYIFQLIFVSGLPGIELPNPIPDGSVSNSLATVKSCLPNLNEGWLTVLPGMGWDNLVNEERGPTLDRERYEKCSHSADGRFIIPDDVIVESRKHSQLDLTSDVFESTAQCTSLTAYSVNAAVDLGINYYRINGDFSFEKESLREHVGSSKGLIVRTQLRHTRYTAKAMPDSTLHPRLRNRLLDIAAYLESGNVTLEQIEHFDKGNTDPILRRGSQTSVDETQLVTLEAGLKAFYLADLIVRDYGTHSISSVDAGGVLVKIDILDEDTKSLTQQDRWTVAASASTTFASILKLKVGGSMSSNQSVAEQYNKKSTHSRISSFGGPIFRAYQMNLSDWEQGLDDHLVAIDRSGQPIHELITGRSMPELAEHVVMRLSKTIKSAVERYYKTNAVIGCMDPSSAFFDRDANVDAEMCTNTALNPANDAAQLPLGGVFQKCNGPVELCATVEVKNPATGDFTCPQGYLSVQLLSPQVRSCITVCHPPTSWHESTKCEQQCAVTVQYWCAIDPSLNVTLGQLQQDDLGMIFGGLFTDKEVNPITHQFSCPEYSWPLVMGRRMRICLSTDRELGAKRAMPFGGFYSCQYGNPLVSVVSMNKTDRSDEQIAVRSWMNTTVERNPRGPKTRAGTMDVPQSGGAGSPVVADYSALFASLWPKRCPHGYTAHLAAMEDTCQVTFCVPANTIKGKRKRYLKRPPFVLPIEFSPSMDKLGPRMQAGNPPTILPSSDGTNLARIDGKWMRSQSSQGFQSKELEQQKAISIALGSTLATMIVMAICVGICVVLVQRAAPRRTCKIDQSVGSSDF